MFSVVLTAYNAADYMEEAIESILNQTFTNWEFLLVVDRTSVDDTVAIAERYEAKDARLRVIKVPFSYQAEKLNLALRAARFPWIAGLDADDIAMPHRLAALHAAIQSRPEVIAWNGFAHYINEKGVYLKLSALGPQTPEHFIEMRQRQEPIMMCHSAAAFRRDIALEVGGYDVALTTCPDMDMFDKLSDRGLMLTLPDPLVYYRVHSNSVTQKNFSLQQHQLRYVYERRFAKNRGETLTYPEFEARQQAIPEAERRKIDRQVAGRLAWRRAGLEFGERRYWSMAQSVVHALIADPRFVTAKAAKQIQARASLRKG